MKLTEIAIDGPLNGLANFSQLRLGRFDGGLNFIYGENASGKSTLRKYIRGVLFGFDETTCSENGGDPIRGHLQVRDAGSEFRLDRDYRTNDSLRFTRLSGYASSSPCLFGDSLSLPGSPRAGNSLSHLVGKLSPELYDAVLNFSFRDTQDNARVLSSVLGKHLGVPLGPAAVGDDSEYQIWKRETKARDAKLTSLQTRVEELSRQRAGYIKEREAAASVRSVRLAELDRQIDSITLQIQGLDTETRRNQLTIIEREIDELRIIVDEASKPLSRSTPVTHPLSTGALFSALYQRLDDVDNQIRRWRRIQSTIQSQRVRLKDEMVVWNELTLESDEHPYHNAREILTALENKVDQAEGQANRWSRNGSECASDPSQLVQVIHDLCKNMRDDLYGLCQELAQQYKHIRHKAAAAELKQLRRCYNEMGENTERLVRRRDSVVQEIRSIDPAGADAIVQAEAKFYQCAMHEGYLTARRRHVAGPKVEVSAHVIAADVSAERRRLDLLQLQRQETINGLAGADLQLEMLHSKHAQLVRERESLRSKSVENLRSAEIARVEAELLSFNEQEKALVRLIESDRHYLAPTPNAILLRAANLLSQVTGGNLWQVWFDESLSDFQTVNEIQVRNRLGKVLNFSALDSTLQDQVYLCLAIAAKEALETRGTSLPIIIDDAFANIARDQVTPMLELIDHLSRSGHQIILLTQHQYLADRVPGRPVFDLSPSTGYTTPIIQPDRPTTIPTPPVVHPRSAMAPHSSVYDFDSDTPIQTSFPGIQSNVDYPMSKYSVNAELPFSEVAELQDQAASREQAYFTAPHPTIVKYDDFYQTDFQQTNDSDRFKSRRAEVSYPIGENHDYRNTRVAAVSVQDVGDQLGYVVAVDENSLLEQLELLKPHHLSALSDVDINTVGQLLELDPDPMIGSLRDSGITSDQLSRWQSYVWLLSNIPGLRYSDARILVACGITDPEHLATSHGQHLNERIQRFLSSSEGNRFISSRHSISLDRINGWCRALNSTRSRWQREDSSSRPLGHRRERPQGASGGQPDNVSAVRDFEPRTHLSSKNHEHSSRVPYVRDYQPHERTPREAYSDSDREAREIRTPRMQTPQPRTKVAPAIKPAVARFGRDPKRSPGQENGQRHVERTEQRESNRNVEIRSVESAEKMDAPDKHRFNLDLKDHIEAAPSIGPKTAERFEKIGVFSVEDFLKQTAESMALKLKYKRITADVVRSWQHQARLVCRIPNLRGHDAQLLAACDFIDPATIGMMQPAALFAIIGPFAESKEGQKIIRSGKQPDLAEVTDWVKWAKQTRALQAA
jgi:energy-coupling factor transporter ATP-binding protein EcfA2